MEDKFFKIYLKLWNAGRFSGCHQMSERSFFVGNWQFPVCARCTGVLIGQFFMVILIIMGIRTSLMLDLTFLAIMFLDWLLQRLQILYSNNTRRLITGLLAGFALTNIYFKTIVSLLIFCC